MPTEQTAAGDSWVVRLWVGGLTLVVAAPVLAPGYVLSYDAVAVPKQSLLPDSLGLGEALPRAVPAEAVTVALTQLVEGQWVQKALLVTLLLVAGLGVAALVPTRRRLTRVVAASAFVWNPFVAERLVLGHWWLLLGYACLPWVVLWSARVARGRPGAWPRLILVLAVGSMVPTAGLLSGLAAIVVLVACRDRHGRQDRNGLWRLGALLGVLAILEAPWWLPGLLHQGAGAAQGVLLFAARAEGSLGVVGTILGLGGVWNSEVVPASRGLPGAAAGTVLAMLGAIYGLRPLRERLRSGEASALFVLGGLGLVLSLWTSMTWGAGALEAISGTSSAGGLLRDSQKFVALWALPLSLLVALAAERLADRVPDRVGSRAVLVGSAFLPLVVLPDLAWGVWGRLEPVDLPPAWASVRSELVESQAPGDVLVLPWGAFRAFGFNHGRTSLDPAPRWLPRPSVVDGRLLVARSGEVEVVSAENERAVEVQLLLDRGSPAVAELAQLGIGWVVVEKDTPGEVPTGFLVGADLIAADAAVDLWQVPGATAGPGWSAGTAAVVSVDLLALLLVALAGGQVLRTRT